MSENQHTHSKRYLHTKTPAMNNFSPLQPLLNSVKYLFAQRKADSQVPTENSDPEWKGKRQSGLAAKTPGPSWHQSSAQREQKHVATKISTYKELQSLQGLNWAFGYMLKYLSLKESDQGKAQSGRAAF